MPEARLVGFDESSKEVANNLTAALRHRLGLRHWNGELTESEMDILQRLAQNPQDRTALLQLQKISKEDAQRATWIYMLSLIAKKENDRITIDEGEGRRIAHLFRRISGEGSQESLTAQQERIAFRNNFGERGEQMLNRIRANARYLLGGGEISDPQTSFSAMLVAQRTAQTIGRIMRTTPRKTEKEGS